MSNRKDKPRLKATLRSHKASIFIIILYLQRVRKHLTFYGLLKFQACMCIVTSLIMLKRNCGCCLYVVVLLVCALAKRKCKERREERWLAQEVL